MIYRPFYGGKTISALFLKVNVNAAQKAPTNRVYVACSSVFTTCGAPCDVQLKSHYSGNGHSAPGECVVSVVFVCLGLSRRWSSRFAVYTWHVPRATAHYTRKHTHREREKKSNTYMTGHMAGCVGRCKVNRHRSYSLESSRRQSSQWNGTVIKINNNVSTV